MILILFGALVGHREIITKTAVFALSENEEDKGKKDSGRAHLPALMSLITT